MPNKTVAGSLESSYIISLMDISFIIYLVTSMSLAGAMLYFAGYLDGKK